MIEELKEERPTLYTKTTIIIFSILLSTFFGGIIYTQNLRETGNRKQIAPVLMFCIIWNVIFFKLVQNFTSNFLLTFILANFFGGLILSTLFWKYHFGELDSIVKRPWIPLIVVLLVYGLFIGIRLFANPVL